MESRAKDPRAARKSRRLRMALLCAIGLLVNLLLARIPGALKLPLFLDNVGSALAAALGGYIPAIVVGFFTNLINGISDYTTAYYGSLTVLIAICSAWFADHGYYNKPWKLPVRRLPRVIRHRPKLPHLLPQPMLHLNSPTRTNP